MTILEPGPSPSRRPQPIVLVMIGVLVAAAIFAIVASTTGGPGSSPSGAGVADSQTTDPAAQTRTDLRNLAVVEETYLTDYDTYTNDSAALAGESFQRDPGDSSTIFVGVDASVGYCLVGAPAGSSTWYLYDSEHGGLSSTTFDTTAAAEAACTDQQIHGFAAV